MGSDDVRQEASSAATGAIVRMVLDWQERQAALSERQSRRELRWRIARACVIVAGFFAAPALSLWAMQQSSSPPAMLGKDYVALVRIEGTIESGGRGSAERINQSLERAFRDVAAKGVVIDINSPGGTPVQSFLIHDRLRALRGQYPKTKVWVVGEDMLTSGAYLVAVGSDHICVNGSTMTGSIGVRLDGWGLHNLLARVDVERRSFTAGAHKERLDMFRPLTEDDKQKAAQLLKSLHGQFIDAVEEGRGRRLQGQRDDLFSGDFWTGAEGVKLGLADRLCSLDSLLKSEFGVESARDFSPPESALAALTANLVKTATNGLTERLGTSSTLQPMLLP
jgi:protease IV